MKVESSESVADGEGEAALGDDEGATLGTGVWDACEGAEVGLVVSSSASVGMFVGAFVGAFVGGGVSAV